MEITLTSVLLSISITLIVSFIVIVIKYNRLIDENEKLQHALKILIETLAFCEKEGNNEI